MKWNNSHTKQIAIKARRGEENKLREINLLIQQLNNWAD